MRPRSCGRRRRTFLSVASAGDAFGDRDRLVGRGDGDRSTWRPEGCGEVFARTRLLAGGRKLFDVVAAMGAARLAHLCRWWLRTPAASIISKGPKLPVGSRSCMALIDASDDDVGDLGRPPVGSVGRRAR